MPFGDEGDGPLEFASCFADEEGFVGFGEEVEVGGKLRFEPIEGGALGPVFGWGEFGEPGAGGGEHEFAAGLEEGGEAVEEEFGFGETADEVGGEDAVKGPEVFAEVHGVALFEGGAGRVEIPRKGDGEVGGEVGFFEAGDLAGALFHLFSGVGEGVGVVDAENLGTVPRHFVGGAADGASDVETAVNRGVGEVFGDPDRIVEGFFGAEVPGEDVFGFGEVEEEVFGEEFVGFVDVAH